MYVFSGTQTRIYFDDPVSAFFGGTVISPSSAYFKAKIPEPSFLVPDLSNIDCRDLQRAIDFTIGVYPGEAPFPSQFPADGIKLMTSYASNHGLSRLPSLVVISPITSRGLLWNIDSFLQKRSELFHERFVALILCCVIRGAFKEPH